MTSSSGDALLERMVTAEENWLRNGHDRESFRLVYVGGMERHVDHPGWDPSWLIPSSHDVDDLVEAGLVRLDASISGNGRVFSLTAPGRRRGQRGAYARRHAPAPASLEWEAVAPVLDAAIAAYEQAGASPDRGVHVRQVQLPDDSPPAAVAELVRAGLLIDVEAESGGIGGVDQVEGPSLVRPSVDALRMRRGWPSGPADAAIDRLVSALLAEAEATTDPEERTRLRRAADWLGKVGTDVLTNVASQQAGGLL